MTNQKYPRRLIALGPPFDDGTYFTANGKPARLPDREDGPSFVARVTAENHERAEYHRARMDQLDSKGHRIGNRYFNGRRCRVETA